MVKLISIPRRYSTGARRQSYQQGFLAGFQNHAVEQSQVPPEFMAGYRHGQQTFGEATRDGTAYSRSNPVELVFA